MNLYEIQGKMGRGENRLLYWSVVWLWVNITLISRTGLWMKNVSPCIFLSLRKRSVPLKSKLEYCSIYTSPRLLKSHIRGATRCVLLSWDLQIAHEVFFFNVFFFLHQHIASKVRWLFSITSQRLWMTDGKIDWLVLWLQDEFSKGNIDESCGPCQ